MASPTVVEVVESEENTWTKTHDITLPGNRSPGDHVLIHWGLDGSGGTITGPAGWATVLAYDLNENQKWYLWLRELDGTELGTVQALSAKASNSAAQAFLIRGARSGTTEGTTWDLERTTSGYGTATDPPAVTASWGSGDQLYLALLWAAPHYPTVQTWPTGYSDRLETGRRIIVASASLRETSTSDDPSGFVVSASAVIRSGTIVFREAASITAGAQTAAGTGTAHDATCTPPTTRAAAPAATGTGTAVWTRTPNEQVSSDLVVEWDLDGDGDFDETVEDITGQILRGEIYRGRDFASQVTGRSVRGQMVLVADNTDDRFSYFNEASPLNQAPFSLRKRRLIRVRCSAASPSDPVVLARAKFGTAGPLTTADTGEAWTTRTSSGMTVADSVAAADGPPLPAVSGPGSIDPDQITMAGDNHTTMTDALRPASGETISVVGTGNLPLTGNATSHNITLPTGIDAGDLIVIWVSTQDSTDPGAPTTPSGYTQRWSQGHASSFRPKITAVYRVADGSEDGATVTFTWGVAVDIVAAWAVFDGVDTTTPWDTTATGPTNGTSNPDPSPITPATGGAWVLEVIQINLPAGTAVTGPSTGFTNLVNQTGATKAMIVAYQATPAATDGQVHLVTLDPGAATYYGQAVIAELDADNEAGLVWYYTDADNYGLVQVRDGALDIIQVASGVESTLGTVAVENRADMAVGVAVNSTTVRAFLDGVFVVGGTTTLTATNHVGLYGRWYAQRPPRFREFWVWNRPRVAQPWESVSNAGVLATMRVESVVPSVGRDGAKIARIRARGVLGDLETEITPPSSVGPDVEESAGVTTGLLIGNALSRVGALHPPGPIAAGIAMGSFGLGRQRALSVIRAVEETEFGLVYETRDGAIGFAGRNDRDGTPVVATFTDDSAVAGLPLEAPRQLDHSTSIINRVSAEVSPSLPRVVASTASASTATGVTNDVAVTIPAEGAGSTDAAVGDLLLVVVASTVVTPDALWEAPSGWVAVRQGLTDDTGLRVFARRLTAGDFGDTVTFYDDAAPAGGAWVAGRFLVKNWYGAIEAGVTMTEIAGHGSGSPQALAGDNDPPVLFTPWPIQPTLFIAVRAGVGATSGNADVSAADDDSAPAGFRAMASTKVEGTSGNADDVALQWATRLRTEQVINPGPFGGTFTGFDVVETAVIAIRGFAGDPPPSTGGFEVRVDNAADQVDRGAVLAHPSPGRHFATETAAETYGDALLRRYGTDRPIVALEFTATKDRRLRDLARDLDLSARVRVDADGRAGLGFDAEFFVEHRADIFDIGDRFWRVELSLSPAVDAGAGADDPDGSLG